MRKPGNIFRAIAACLVVFILLTGCASLRKGPTPEERASIGTVGVSGASYPPEFDYDVPAKGRPDGAAKGAAIAFFGVLAGGMQGGAGAGPGVGIYLIVVTALATAAAPVGAVIGAANAMPGDEAAESEKLALAILERMGTQEVLRDAILREGSGETERSILPVDGIDPVSVDNDVTYGSLAGSGIDTVLEVAMRRIALESEKWGSDPPLRLAMKARCRLVRVGDNTVIDDHEYLSRSGFAKLSEWTADHAEMLEAAYEQGYRELAAGIISRLFLSASDPAAGAGRTRARRTFPESPDPGAGPPLPPGSAGNVP